MIAIFFWFTCLVHLYLNFPPELNVTHIVLLPVLSSQPPCEVCQSESESLVQSYPVRFIADCGITPCSQDLCSFYQKDSCTFNISRPCSLVETPVYLPRAQMPVICHVKASVQLFLQKKEAGGIRFLDQRLSSCLAMQFPAVPLTLDLLMDHSDLCLKEFGRK